MSVIRCCALSDPDASRSLPRLASYFSFVLSSLVVGIFALGQLDYLITESPPLFLGISAATCSAGAPERGGSSTCPTSGPRARCASASLHDGASLRAAEALEAFCYRKAWLVDGPEPGDPRRHRAPVSRGRRRTICPTAWIPTCFVPDRRSDDRRGRAASDAAAPDGACLAVYAGLHGIAQGLDQILEAAALVRNGALRILLVGDGPEKARLVEQRRRLGLKNVRFLEPQGRSEMPALMASADLALVPLSLHIPGAVPSKLYEAMGAGVAGDPRRRRRGRRRSSAKPAPAWSWRRAT